MALKGNQETLFDDVKTYLDDPEVSISETTEVDAGHGRIEQRTAAVSTDIDWLQEHQARNRKDNGPENIAILRDIALNIVKANKSRVQTASISGAQVGITASSQISWLNSEMRLPRRGAKGREA